MNDERTWEVIREFVALQCAVPADTLTPETTLFGHLGVDGDDALEFFEAFRDRFNVDLASFNPRRHFGPEGWPLRYFVVLPVRLHWMARSGDAHKQAGVQPICLSELVTAVQTGYWATASCSM